VFCVERKRKRKKKTKKPKNQKTKKPKNQKTKKPKNQKTLQTPRTTPRERQRASPLAMGDAAAEHEGGQLAQDIQRRLVSSAEPATRLWFEEKAQLGRWRGNKSDASKRAVFAAVGQWMDARTGGGYGQTVSSGVYVGGGIARYHAALQLMKSVYSDDKLAGMILFQVRAI
jgi:hypothetical protein